MDSVTVNAPAKLNLFLKVLERKPDGYHKIETLFEKIALFDNIRLKKAQEGISVSSNEKDLPDKEGNLAYRAAALMEKRYKVHLGVSIEIEKSIPIGAGLGGGSSDCTAVLAGINRLYEMGLSKDELLLLAKELGADCPFFLADETWAVGRDRGDAIEGIDTRMKLWHIIIIPPFCVSPKDAYEWAEKIKETKPDIDAALASVRANDIETLGKNLYNALEGLTFEKAERLKELKRKLIEYGAKGAVITGSGPALFGIASDKEEVMRLKKRIEKDLATQGNTWRVLVAPTYNE